MARSYSQAGLDALVLASLGRQPCLVGLSRITATMAQEKVLGLRIWDRAEWGREAELGRVLEVLGPAESVDLACTRGYTPTLVALGKKRGSVRMSLRRGSCAYLPPLRWTYLCHRPLPTPARHSSNQEERSPTCSGDRWSSSTPAN